MTSYYYFIQCFLSTIYATFSVCVCVCVKERKKYERKKEIFINAQTKNGMEHSS